MSRRSGRLEAKHQPYQDKDTELWARTILGMASKTHKLPGAPVASLLLLQTPWLLHEQTDCKLMKMKNISGAMPLRVEIP